MSYRVGVGRKSKIFEEGTGTLPLLIGVVSDHIETRLSPIWVTVSNLDALVQTARAYGGGVPKFSECLASTWNNVNQPNFAG